MTLELAELAADHGPSLMSAATIPRFRRPASVRVSEPYEPHRFDPAIHVDELGQPLTGNAITLFETSKFAVKSFVRSASGVTLGLPYKPAFHGKARVYAMADLNELFQFLEWAEKQRRSFVMRGQPCNSKKRIVRRCKTEPKTFVDLPRHWCCFDIDDLPIPPGLSYECPEELAEYVVAKLPREHFGGVSYIWQLSSSAAIKDTHKIKLHLWFWFDQPRDCTQLRGWLKTLKGPFDPALYNPVQPHITARPRFLEGLQDPFPTRTGMVTKASNVVRDAARLQAPPATQKRKTQLRKRKIVAGQPLRAVPFNGFASGSPFRNWGPFLHEVEREQHFHGPIYQLILSYLGCGGADADELKARIRLEIRPRNTSGRSDVDDRYMTDAYLDEQIQSALRFRESSTAAGR